MNNIEKLQRIRARCVELLAIAGKRTPGEWANRYHRAEVHNQYDHTVAKAVPQGSDYSNVFQTFCDGDFIASCAGAAEAGWRSTIAAIDGWAINGFHPMNPNDDTGDGPKNCICRHCQAVKTILAAWPEELL